MAWRSATRRRTAAARGLAWSPARRPDDQRLVERARGHESIRLARSTDGGRTFDAPTILQSDGVSGDRGWPALAVDGSGTAHAIWLDHRGLAARRAAAGGKHGRQAHTATTGVDSSVMAQGSSLYHAATGAGMVQEREVTKGVCYCCKTALATGPGDLLVAAWRHVYPGDLRDIALSLSHDAGRSFSAPARVSEDGWAINGCPDDGPAMAVGAGGSTSCGPRSSPETNPSALSSTRRRETAGSSPLVCAFPRSAARSRCIRRLPWPPRGPRGGVGQIAGWTTSRRCPAAASTRPTHAGVRRRRAIDFPGRQPPRAGVSLEASSRPGRQAATTRRFAPG